MPSLIITNPTSWSPSWTDHIRGHALASVHRVLEVADHRAEEALLAGRPTELQDGRLVGLGDDVAELDRGHQGSAGRGDRALRGPRRGTPATARRARGRRARTRAGRPRSRVRRRADWRRPAMASMSRRWYALRSFSASSDRPVRSCGGPGQRWQTTPPSGGTQRNRSSDSRTRSHSTQRSTSGRCAELIEQMHLVPARDPARRHAGVEQLVGPLEQGVQRLGGVPLLEGAVGQLGEVPGRRGGSRASRAGPARRDRPGPRSRHRTSGRGPGPTVSSANGSRLPPRREVGRRTPLAMALSLPPVGVMSVRTRSASPRSNLDRTIASVV